jgi:hypothetical protein
MFRQISRVGHVELCLVLQQRQLPVDASDKGVVGNLENIVRRIENLI